MTVPTWMRSRRNQALMLGAVLLGTAYWFLPTMLTNTIIDEGGGPPDASVIPPFDEDQFEPLQTLAMPAGEPCTWLADDALSSLFGTSPEANPTPDGCRWEGNGIAVEVSTISQPITVAIATVAEDWPRYPEVVSDPVNGLFLLDESQSALLLDAGQSTVLVEVSGIDGERAAHLNFLGDIAESLAS